MSNPGFDPERFRALMALEKALETGRREPPRAPAERMATWTLEPRAGEKGPETVREGGPETVRETEKPEARGPEPAEKTEPPEETEPAAAEPPEPPEPMKATEPELPEPAEAGPLPPEGAEHGPEEDGDAGEDLRTRRCPAPEEGPAEEAPAAAEGTLYRVELPPPGAAERTDGPVLVRRRAEPETAAQEDGPAVQAASVRLEEETAARETGPENGGTGESLRDWDRRWERESRRYDGGFSLY